MAEKRDWNAKLNSKGLDKSVNEEQAKFMCLHQGSTHVFIVQAHAGPKTVNEDGSEVVNLIPDLVELVPEAHAERIRTFQRALYLERPEQFGQEAFDGAAQGEPDSATAGAAVDAVIERDDTGAPTGIWSGDTDEPGEGNVAPLFKDA